MSATTVTALPLGPLDPERCELLLRVVDGLEPASLHWLSGFAAGVAHERSAGARGIFAPSVAPRTEPAARLAVVYGSQTGNGRRIAERLGPRRRGRRAWRCASMRRGAYPLQGSRAGAAADGRDEHARRRRSARRCARLHRVPRRSKRAPKLEQLTYAVLALGDSSYPKFCETGRQVDERLAALGAHRLIDARRLRRRLRAARRAVARHRSSAGRARRSAARRSPP